MLRDLRTNGPRKLAHMLRYGPDGGEVRLLGQMVIVLALSTTLKVGFDCLNYVTADPAPKAPAQAESRSAARPAPNAAPTPDAQKWIPEVPKPSRPAAPTPPAVLDLDAPAVLDLDAPATGARK